MRLFQSRRRLRPCAPAVAGHRAEQAALGTGASNPGFTVIELLVAVVILSVGVLGLAGTSAVILNQMTRANAQTSGSQVAASRFENLSGRKCPTVGTTGSATSRGITESWKVVPGDNSTVVAELVIAIPGRSRAERFSTVISCFP